MIFKLRTDWFGLCLRLVQFGGTSASVLFIAQREQSAILYALGIVGLCIGAIIIYFELTRKVEITDKALIVHWTFANHRVPLADITKITRKRQFELRSNYDGDLKGLIIRDGHTTSTGETEVAVRDEQAFIQSLLAAAPHIHNELVEEKVHV